MLSILSAMQVAILLIDFLALPTLGSQSPPVISTNGTVNTTVFYKRGVMRSELYEEFSKSWWVHHEVEREYDRLKSYGVEVVRVMLNKHDWFMNYTIADIDGNRRDYHTVVDDIVRWCTDRGMYVILEHGVSVWGETPETAAQGIYLDPHNWFIDWMTNEIAARYANNPYVIMGLVNEPANRDAGIYNTEDARRDRWWQIAKEAVESYRAVKPNGYIIVQSIGFRPYKNWSRAYGRAPLPFPNIIYGWHDFYHWDLGSIVGKPYAPAPYAEAYWNGDFVTAKQKMEQWYYDTAIKLQDEEHVPVFFDEFGAWVPDNNWDIWLRDFYVISRKYSVGWTQLWWHGYWTADQGTPSRPYIDYHLLQNDWQTLSPIGEVWAAEMK